MAHLRAARALSNKYFIELNTVALNSRLTDEGVGEQGGVMNTKFFGWGFGPPLGPLPDVIRLGPFKHELHFR